MAIALDICPETDEEMYDIIDAAPKPARRKRCARCNELTHSQIKLGEGIVCQTCNDILHSVSTRSTEEDAADGIIPSYDPGYTDPAIVVELDVDKWTLVQTTENTDESTKRVEIPEPDEAPFEACTSCGENILDAAGNPRERRYKIHLEYADGNYNEDFADTYADSIVMAKEAARETNVRKVYVFGVHCYDTIIEDPLYSPSICNASDADTLKWHYEDLLRMNAATLRKALSEFKSYDVEDAMLLEIGENKKRLHHLARTLIVLRTGRTWEWPTCSNTPCACGGKGDRKPRVA